MLGCWLGLARESKKLSTASPTAARSPLYECVRFYDLVVQALFLRFAT
jgi:hypothetical protein